MNEKIAIYAGSFDPITNGHINLIEKASKMYDKVIIGVLSNIKKTPTFLYEERMDMICKSTEHLKNIEIKCFNGLLVNFAEINNAGILIRGLRSVTDFENELQICMANKMLAPETETIFLVADAQYQYVSSSMVREIAGFGGNIKGLVPDIILPNVLKILAPH